MTQCEEKYRIWQCIQETGHYGLHMACTGRANNLHWNTKIIQERTPRGEVVSEVQFYAEADQ